MLLALQDGLPLTPRPYEAVAKRIESTEERVLSLLASLLERGIVKRLGAVINHRTLGITANAMAVWDVPDAVVSDLGHRLAAYVEVTHCYRRSRGPEWPYNLYAMVHARSREEALATIARIAEELGLAGYPHDALFSVRQFAKRGARVKNHPPE